MNDFDTLKKNGISLLRLSAYEWSLLADTKHKGSRFTWTFPHESAKSAKKNSLVIILVEEGAQINKDGIGPDDDRYGLDLKPGLKVGFVKSRQAVSTLDSRVSFDLIADLSEASLSDLFVQIPESNLKATMSRLSRSTSKFERISEKLGGRLVEILLQSPVNIDALRPIVYRLNIPKRNGNARALQLDALKLALKAFGADETNAVEIKLSSSDTALAGARLQEDAVIEHDAREVKGWSLNRSESTGWARFIRGRGRDALEIFTANKLPLEELFGVDLIYLNQIRKSLVMVQYKMLEPTDRDWTTEASDEKEWTVRIDKQFKKELGKMTLFDQDLEPNGDYRLNPTAFFFKLVKRHGEMRSGGIVISREHLQSLIENGSLTGPNRGLKISYRELDGHYIRSGGFIELIRSGYVGSRGATTDHLETLIDTALTEGRAVVGAIQSVLPYDISFRNPIDEMFQPLEVNDHMAPNWRDEDDI
ncbi:hypothetical protein KA344_10195 [bacterium]|nr:hypothetical protein [bacterium]